MRNATIRIPQSQIVDILKALPEKKVIEIFNEVIVSYDNSPLTHKEKKLIKVSIAEYKAGELVDYTILKQS